MNPDQGWEVCSLDLADDSALTTEVLAVHEAILNGPLAADPMLNRALAIEQRALRRIDDWRVLLLLTPWMLVRLLFPDRPPIELPPGWTANERARAPYQILGPSLRFELLGQVQQAHLSYQPRLGHFLLQPICLDMEGYRDADAVFEAWNQVIRTRDENMEKARRDCPMQKEISRRELFRRLKPST